MTALVNDVAEIDLGDSDRVERVAAALRSRRIETGRTTVVLVREPVGI